MESKAIISLIVVKLSCNYLLAQTKNHEIQQKLQK